LNDRDAKFAHSSRSPFKFQYNKASFAKWQSSLARNCPAASECWNGLKNRQGGANPPGNLHECQKKGVTKFAFRKLLILKDAILVVWGKQGRNGCPGKEKREQAPALHTQLSTG
jgi:hypothetical protein